jgi:hypothetical protein
VQLSEHPVSEGVLDSFEAYLRESCEDAVLPATFSEESVKMLSVHPALGFAKMLPRQGACLVLFQQFVR